MPEPLRDDVADALWDRGHAFDREQPDRLGDEEGVPFRLLVEPRGEARSSDLRCRQPDVRVDVALAQAVQRDASRGRLAGERSENPVQLVARERIDIAKRAANNGANRGDVPGNELQEQQRRQIGGVQVVQDDHERALRRGGAHELRCRIEEAKARTFGVG